MPNKGLIPILTMDAWRTKFGKDSMQIKTKNKKKKKLGTIAFQTRLP